MFNKDLSSLLQFDEMEVNRSSLNVSSMKMSKRSSHMPQTLTFQKNIADDVPKNRIKRIKTKDSKSNQEIEIYIRQKLDISTDTILKGNGRILFSYESLYRNVEFLCRLNGIHGKNGASELASDIHEKIESHFTEYLYPRILESINQQDSPRDSLQSFIDVFNEWERRLESVGKIYLYLDRSYLHQSISKLEIRKYGLDVFVQQLLAKNTNSLDESEEKVTRNLILVHFSRICYAYRETESQEDYKLMIEFMNIIEKLNFKKDIKIETFLKEDAKRTYQALRSKWLVSSDNYIQLVMDKIGNEEQFFIQCGTTPKFVNEVVAKIQFILIYDDFKDILNKCLGNLIDRYHDGSLNKLYEICCSQGERNPNLTLLAYEWGELMKRKIEVIIKNSENNTSVELILDLVKFFEDMNQVCESSFKSDEKYNFELRESFIKAFSKHSRLIIEKLCKYSDHFFKNVSKTKNGVALIESTADKVLENIITILKLIRDKGTFIQTYQRDLSRRLLYNRSNDMASEVKLVDEFTNIIGEGDACSNLLLMFKDLDISKDLTSSFDNFNDSYIDFNSLILNKKAWPEIRINNITLPKELQEVLDGFESFYKSKNSDKKKLDWCYTLHNCTVTANFPLGKKELNMNFFQTLIMLAFNETEELSYSEVQKAIGVEDRILKSTLNSLIEGKYKLLISDSPEFKSIRLNNAFSDRAVKLKIPTVQYKERVSSHTKDPAPVVRDRADEYCSSLLKIMKAEKKLAYEVLINGVLEMVRIRGEPSIREIKTALDYLIEHEYVKREQDGVHFSYLA